MQIYFPGPGDWPLAGFFAISAWGLRPMLISIPL